MFHNIVIEDESVGDKMRFSLILIALAIGLECSMRTAPVELIMDSHLTEDIFFSQFRLLIYIHI